MIKDADEYLAWFEAPPSEERTRALLHEPAPVETWMEIVDRYPQCQRMLTRNRTLPMEVMEHLRSLRDYGVQWSVRSRDAWQVAHPEDPSIWNVDPHELVEYELSEIERGVLRQGLLQWGGPAQCTTEMALAIGFRSVEDLFDDGDRIMRALIEELPMTHLDWARSLLATEVVFMSNVVGAALDWEIVTGYSDQETFDAIRALQRHLIVRPVVRHGLGTPRPDVGAE